MIDHRPAEGSEQGPATAPPVADGRAALDSLGDAGNAGLAGGRSAAAWAASGLGSPDGFRRMLEALPVIAWLTDEHGRFIAANGRWPEYVRNDPSAAHDPDGADLGVHPDDHPGLTARWQRCLRTGEPLELAIRLQRHDGVYRWHLVRAVPFDAEGGRRHWMGTSTDIEDERRERQRRTLVADAAARLDASLEVEATVRALSELLVPAVADGCHVELDPDAPPAARVDDAQGDVDTESDMDESDEGTGGVRALSPAGTDGIGDSDLRAPGAATAVGRGHPPDGAPHSTVRDATAVAGSRYPSPPRRRRGRQLELPLVARGQQVGSVRLTRTAGREPFAADDRATASEIAHHAALAILNGRLYDREREARRRAELAAERTRRLFRLTRALSRASDRAEVAQLALRHGRAALGAPRGYLFVRSEDGLALEALAMAGYPEDTDEAWARVDLAVDRPMTHAVREGKEQWIDDLGAFRRRYPGTAGPSAPSTHATASLPLLADGRTIGVIGFAWTGRQRLPEDERVFARAIAGLVAQALHRLFLVEAREALVADLETQHARMVTVIRQLPGGVLLADGEGRLVLANDVAVRTLGGAPLADTIQDLPLAATREDGSPYGAGEWPLERAIWHGETVENEVVILAHPEGGDRHLLASAAPIRDRTGRVEAGVVTFSDITDRRRAQQNEQYLAAATALLAETLDEEAALASLASLAVPRVADWCSVEVVDPDGSIRQVIVAHPDPEKAELARELRRRFPVDPNGPVGAPAVLRTGISQLVTEIPPEMLDALDLDEEVRMVVEGLGLRSFMCVPLRGRGGVLGAITFVGAESGRRFGPEDLVFAERLAERAASAMDNARLFREADRFRRIVEAEADAVFLFDPATFRVGYANRGAGRALGSEPRDIVGTSAVSLFEDLDADGFRELVTPILAGSSDSRMLLLTLRGARGPMPVELLIQGVTLPGEPPAVLAIARDVSERIESQARLRRLAEAEHARAAELDAVIHAMGEGVLVCSADGSVTLANPAAHELAGGGPLREYSDLLRLFESPGEAPALGVRGGPTELRLSDADERWLEVTTYPVGILGRDGGRETIVMLRDVTEARLSAAVRDTFVGVLSHELRTPLTTIFGGSKVLARDSGLGDEERQAIFTDIHLEAERLHRLVEDVIALTRFGETGGDIGSEPVLLQRILPAIVRAEEARWPGATFEISMPPGLPTVVADPTYVEQVLRNLLSNAAKYGGEGVVVETVVSATEDEVTVRILDDGPGIDEAEADRLFDLFFRSPKTAGRVSGAGIGLFVCSRLIRAMGGRVWARRRETGGSEFGFALRLMDEDAS